MGASLRVPLAYAPDWPSALATYLAPSEAGAAGGAVWLHAADARAAATPYFDVAWADGGRHALVVGAEAAGLSPWVRAAAEASADAAAAPRSRPGSRRNGGAEVRVDFVSIPLAAAPHSLAAHAAGASSSPAVESLNAAVAGSIVLCEAHRQIIASDRRAKII
jgi:tRNA G18 (ribose-2'-O)-methylase SpoU